MGTGVIAAGGAETFRAGGLQPQEVSDILGLYLTTVKSHLARNFCKSTSRQTDLVALMMRANARSPAKGLVAEVEFYVRMGVSGTKQAWAATG